MSNVSRRQSRLARQHWQSALQREFPPDKLARVSSLDWMFSFGFMPIGLALTGPLSAAVGQQTVLLGAAVACVVITFVVLRVPGVAEFETPPDRLRSPASQK